MLAKVRFKYYNYLSAVTSLKLLRSCSSVTKVTEQQYSERQYSLQWIPEFWGVEMKPSSSTL